MSAALPRAVVVALGRYRQRWGLTLDQLADRTGLSPVALAGYESGTAVPQAEAAETLITVLQLDEVSATALRAAAEGTTAEERARPASPGGRYDGWDDRQACFVTTIGRRTGRPHEHECRLFVVDGDRLFLLDAGGGRAGWYRDIQAHEGVSLRVARDRVETGRAAALPAGDADAERARMLATKKYPAARDDVAAAAVARIASFRVG